MLSQYVTGEFGLEAEPTGSRCIDWYAKEMQAAQSTLSHSDAFATAVLGPFSAAVEVAVARISFIVVTQSMFLLPQLALFCIGTSLCVALFLYLAGI